jgi:hypothetical protein
MLLCVQYIKVLLSFLVNLFLQLGLEDII